MNDANHATDISDIAPSLEQVQQRFESWRQRRKKRTRIPQNLWKAAAAIWKKMGEKWQAEKGSF